MLFRSPHPAGDQPLSISLLSNQSKKPQITQQESQPQSDEVYRRSRTSDMSTDSSNTSKLNYIGQCVSWVHLSLKNRRKNPNFQKNSNFRKFEIVLNITVKTAFFTILISKAYF